MSRWTLRNGANNAVLAAGHGLLDVARLP
jgi:hypothetical protein